MARMFEPLTEAELDWLEHEASLGVGVYAEGIVRLVAELRRARAEAAEHRLRDIRQAQEQAWDAGWNAGNQDGYDGAFGTGPRIVIRGVERHKPANNPFRAPDFP